MCYAILLIYRVVFQKAISAVTNSCDLDRVIGLCRTTGQRWYHEKQEKHAKNLLS